MSIVASCHCGATRIELPRHPSTAKECNCSYCARTGAVWAYFGPGELRFVAQHGEQTYSASDGMNQHHFCGRCGMQTWGDSLDWSSVYTAEGTPKAGFTGESLPTQRTYAVNLRLIDDLDWSKVAVEKVDGRSNW